MLYSFRCFFVHNCLMDVFSGIMTWFTTLYYNDFKMKVLGTYDRAKKEIEDFYKQGKQPETIPLPAISMNPFGDITSDPKFPQLWRLKDIGENLQDLYLEPEYEDEYFGFSVIAHRFTGNFEVVLFLQSPYEFLDHYIQSIMFFHGGYNRRVRPGLIRTNVIIPDEVITNAYNGTPYDWTETGISQSLIKVLNKQCFLYPIFLGPQIWLSSITNGSTVYGEEGLPVYRIQMVVEYDVEIPTHIIVRGTDRIKNMNIKLMTYDPVLIPEVPILKDNEYQIIIDDQNLRGAPENILGPDPYFKRFKVQEYQRYMFAPQKFLQVCKNNRSYKHILTLQYQFERDVSKSESFQISLYDKNIKLNTYDEIIIGDRKGVLVFGTAYSINLEDDQQYITVKMDVTKNTIWDIFVYTLE